MNRNTKQIETSNEGNSIIVDVKTSKQFEVLLSSFINYSYFLNRLSILDDNSLIENFYIITAIYYMNGIVHIVHTYEAITTDKRNERSF